VDEGVIGVSIGDIDVVSTVVDIGVGVKGLWSVELESGDVL